MRLVIHTGWSRTGTTAIQIALAKYANDLMAKGVLLPECGRNPFGAHHEIATAVRDLERGDTQSLEVLLQDLDREIENSSAHTVLLTSELFPFKFSSEPFAEWAMNRFDDVDILCAIRQQSSWLISAYSQHANTAFDPPPMRLLEFALRYWDALDIEAAIRSWQATSFISRVRVLKYSRNILSDFFKEIGLEEITQIIVDRDENVNTSIDQSLLLILPTLREALSNDQGRVNQAIGFLNNYERSFGLLERTVLFSSDEQSALDELFEKGNEIICNEFFGTPKALTSKEYKDVICIKSLSPSLLSTLCLVKRRD